MNQASRWSTQEMRMKLWQEWITPRTAQSEPGGKGSPDTPSAKYPLFLCGERERQMHLLKKGV